MSGVGVRVSSDIFSGSHFGLQSQYYYFDDGETYMRLGTRLVGSDQMYGIDTRLTDSPGFAGIEGIDFEMIYPIIV
jgi:hypothetical protein